MNQEKTSDKAAMLARIGKIHEVPGFDPSFLAVNYTDLNTQEVRKRLPVMVQMAWFRLKYPEGRIAVQVSAGKDCFVATARIYPHYKEPADCYLAEATASRGYCEEKPSVSPREWAQTAAVGVALRNAGFGLQFAMAGDDFADMAPDELGLQGETPEPEKGAQVLPEVPTPGKETAVTEPVREKTLEEKLKEAMQIPCPIIKYSGRTLGDVLSMDPAAIKWIATKYDGEKEAKEAAQLICEYALQQATA